MKRQSTMITHDKPSYDAIISNFTTMQPVSSSNVTEAILNQQADTMAADIESDLDNDFGGDAYEED